MILWFRSPRLAAGRVPTKAAIRGVFCVPFYRRRLSFGPRKLMVVPIQMSAHERGGVLWVKPTPKPQFRLALPPMWAVA